MEGKGWRGMEERRLQVLFKACVCALLTAEQAASMPKSLGSVYWEKRSVCATGTG